MIPLPLNPRLASAHYFLIENDIERRRIFIIKNKGLLNQKGEMKTSLDDVSLRYLENIRGNCLKNLIEAEPAEFNKIINFHKILLNKSEVLLDVIYNLFIGAGYDQLNKFNFIKQFGIDTCPYCNRNYIYSFEKDDKSIKPQIDHFYPKEKYPYLGISFYNLIPSCLPCNGLETKRNHDPKEVGLLSPYEIKENDFHFSVDLTGLDFSKSRIMDSFHFKMDKKIAGNASVFHLNEFYQFHKDHALELIMKSEFEYSDVYKEMLSKIEGLNLSKEEINRMIVGNYVNLDELHKRPLSKMYRDLAIDLGLISES